MKAGKDYIGVGCGAFILNENNELLLQIRNKAPEKGYWCIPGGHETFEDAIIREVKEETDLDVQVIKILGICDHIVDIENEEKVHWVTPSFLCEVTYGTAKIMEPGKHTKMDWFKLDNLPEKLTITTKKALSDYWNNN